MIRQLRPGEPLPSAPPRRYVSSHGYIRLRWKTGVGQYVETYEHRVANGFVTSAEHVHHVNHDKGDNRPDNLKPLSASEHLRTHGGFDVAEAIRLYEAGRSTLELAALFGVANSSIYRRLQRHGVTMRGGCDVASLRRRALAGRILSSYFSGATFSDIAAEVGTGTAFVRHTLRDFGIYHRSGNPHGQRISRDRWVTEHPRLAVAAGLSLPRVGAA